MIRSVDIKETGNDGSFIVPEVPNKLIHEDTGKNEAQGTDHFDGKSYIIDQKIDETHRIVKEGGLIIQYGSRIAKAEVREYPGKKDTMQQGVFEFDTAGDVVGHVVTGEGIGVEEGEDGEEGEGSY